jgi:hypothetical protein
MCVEYGSVDEDGLVDEVWCAGMVVFNVLL